MDTNSSEQLVCIPGGSSSIHQGTCTCRCIIHVLGTLYNVSTCRAHVHFMIVDA